MIGTGSLVLASETFVTTWEDITITCSISGPIDVNLLYKTGDAADGTAIYEAIYPAAQGCISITATVDESSRGSNDTLKVDVFGNTQKVTSSTPGVPLTAQITGIWPGDYPNVSHTAMVTYHS